MAQALKILKCKSIETVYLNLDAAPCIFILLTL